MYARTYAGKEYNFEPSGGLIDGALVMQDFETDSYWYIMNHQALRGAAKGTTLRELPVSRKMMWKDWRARHPETLVLSVNGREDSSRDPYGNYFRSAKGFRGLSTPDGRLKTKESIFAINLNGAKLAAPFSAFEGGAVLTADAVKLFLYRPSGVEIFHSTVAFEGADVKRVGERFVHRPTGATFDPKTTTWKGGAGPAPVVGFDTFWVSWSLANPKTVILVGLRGTRRSF